MMTKTIWMIWLALFSYGQHDPRSQHHHDPRHSFADTDQWVDEFENDERDQQQKPDEVVRALKLSPGDVVADIGAGTGYFTRRLAKAVGEKGIVYAVDIEPNMLQHIAEQAERAGQRNVVPVLGTATSPMLAPSSVDLVFICNTIHHIGGREQYYRILAESLRDGGRLAIVDFEKDAELERGPSPAMRIAKEALIDEVTAAGFRLVEDHDFLAVQYFLVFST